MFFPSCVCYAFVCVFCASWLPAGKGLTSWQVSVLFIIGHLT